MYIIHFIGGVFLAILKWLLNKGLARAIAKDLAKKYIKLKDMYPLEEESKIVDRVWNFWLTLNKEEILKSNDEHHIVRLNIMEGKYNESMQFINNLYDLYKTIIYIETEISVSNGNLYDNVIKVFLTETNKAGLNYQKAYENERRFLSKINF